MTRLGKFACFLLAALGGWGLLLALSKERLSSTLLYKCFLMPLPFWGLVFFGVYSASVVLHRTMTFNDCPEAAQELLQEIEDARKDLRKKGMKSI